MLDHYFTITLLFIRPLLLHKDYNNYYSCYIMHIHVCAELVRSMRIYEFLPWSTVGYTINNNYYSHTDWYIIIYCMKPPNIKAPKCTLLSIQCFIIQGQRSQALIGLATAHCEHRWGQLTLESPFQIVESG